MQRSCFRYFGLSKTMGWNFSSSWKLPTTSPTKLRVINSISFCLRNYPCHLTLILSSFKLLTWSSTNQGLLHKLIVVAHWFETSRRNLRPVTNAVSRRSRNPPQAHTTPELLHHGLSSSGWRSCASLYNPRTPPPWIVILRLQIHDRRSSWPARTHVVRRIFDSKTFTTCACAYGSTAVAC
jgi:hypothetical protein